MNYLYIYFKLGNKKALTVATRLFVGKENVIEFITYLSIYQEFP